LKLALFCVVAVDPVSVMVTCAVELAVPDGIYCTFIVQPGVPGLMTKPDTQVPPVIEKVPRPAVLVIVGTAVRVSGPPVEVTVMVPIFVFNNKLVVLVVSAGAGPVNAGVPTSVVPVSATV
jgi:hypothetical protein